MKPPFSSRKVQTVCVLSSNKWNNSTEKKKNCQNAHLSLGECFFFFILNEAIALPQRNVLPGFKMWRFCFLYIIYHGTDFNYYKSARVCMHQSNIYGLCRLRLFCILLPSRGTREQTLQYVSVCIFSLDTSCDVLRPSCFLQLHFSEDDLSVFSSSAFCRVLSLSLNTGPLLITGVTWAEAVQQWV